MRPGRYLKLSVRDTGPGIPKKVRTRIFEPFFTTKKAGEGTGMGLALVFGLVKGHEGAITVESEPGEGATFNIFFPAQKKKAEEETYEQDSLPRGNESILLVDDEPLVVDMAKETLQRLGYAVTTAPGGSEGWRLFELDPDGFDLVITDHVMPDMTGMRLAERILEVREDFPIILFTGYSETVSSEKARAAGISAFVMKPVAKRELAETVRRVLDKK
jgi:CheY-like chemotaxis protein